MEYIEQNKLGYRHKKNRREADCPTLSIALMNGHHTDVNSRQTPCKPFVIRQHQNAPQT